MHSYIAHAIKLTPLQVHYYVRTSTRMLIQVATGTMDSLPALQADCSASWEVHDWACVRAACLLHPQERRRRASRYSPFACTLHAGYAKQVMHVSVPLPPEKANSDALVLGSWQMHHIHTSRQSARNYSKRCTLSSLMHPHGDAWASSVPTTHATIVHPHGDAWGPVVPRGPRINVYPCHLGG